MPPNRFNEDLSRAQSKRIHGVSDLARGDEHGTIKFTYNDEKFHKPIVIHMIFHDCMAYPQNAGFVIFSEYDDTDYDIPGLIDSVCQKQKWSDIEGAVRVIATALASGIEKRDQGISDDSDGADNFDGSHDSPWDYGSDFEDLDPIKTTQADGTHQNSPGYDDHVVVDSPSALTLAALRNSLKKAQAVGIDVNVYSRPGSELPAIVSLAVPTSCLGVDTGILEAWGLKQTEYLVLLIRIGRQYPTLAEFLAMSSRQKALQFRFGKCLGEKPSSASVQSVYSDPNHPSCDVLTFTDDTNTQDPFELINMSSSIDRLLNAEFSRILEMKRRFTLSWPHAQRLVSQTKLQSEKDPVQAEEINRATPEFEADTEPFQNLIGPISQDAALDEQEAFSLPLVAMQFALHRLANCPRYCMECNSCLKESPSALKPYVCSTPLCLFQYLTLGLGSTIEHEIVNAPYVVDMLICFLYAALSDSTSRELPDGLGIKTTYVDDVGGKWAEGSYVAATANIKSMKLRDLDYSTLKTHPWVPFRKGDRVLVIYRELAGMFPGRFIKSWCQLKEYVQGEWILECHYSSELPYEPPKNSSMSTLSDKLISGGKWREAMLFGYWQSIDDLDLDSRKSALLNILDGLPSVLEMREYLMAQPGKRLASWTRIHKSELTVLNWTVASNRSLIVQDDVIEVKRKKEVAPRKDSRKTGHDDEDMLGWMQFRFLQGSPGTEQRFEHNVRQLSETTRTPTIFAWHGSPLKNWHSIIRTGLDYSVIEHGRAAGNGVYFSNSVMTSLRYSQRRSLIIHRFRGWPMSDLKISSAIAVCELINCPDKFVSRRPYVVDRLDWIQCRYLLVATKPSAEAIAFPFYEPQTSEPPAHIDQDKDYPLIGPSGPVEIPITAIPPSRRALHSTRPIPEPASMWNRLLSS